MEKACRNCGRTFTPHPSVFHQEFCGEPDCQRARKRLWQQKKLAQDRDYRENKSAAQKKWLRRNPNYWRDYRKRNPAVTERNRLKQHERNSRRQKSNSMIAKMDELGVVPVLVPGMYRLVMSKDDVIAKNDELIIQISSISRVCDSPASLGS